MNTKNKIIAILMAGIVAMAMVVPMAMGDEATQSATVSKSATIVQLKQPVSPWGDVTTWTFAAGAAGSTDLEPADQPVVAANNTGSASQDVYMYATDWSDGTNTIAINNEQMKVGTGAYANLATSASSPQISSLAPNANKTLSFQLDIPNDAVAGSYTSTFTVESSYT